MQTFPITQEGFDKLLQEYEHLRKVVHPAIIQQVAEARSLGDLRENAEYHAAREQQAHIQNRMKYLSDCLSGAQIISVSAEKSDAVRFGSKVRTHNLDEGIEEEFILVGAAEVDPNQGKISTVSPLGKSLLGKKKDDIVVVTTPGGSMSLKIVEVC